MTDEELLERLESVEWDDIEFKAAKTAAPKSALATVSAFANTGGGHIVMGVSEVDDALKITGVEKVDKVQREFTSLLRDQKKISLAFSVDPTVHHIDGKTMICFYIPEARRGDKPVYLDGDIAKTYIRRGAENCRCTRTELSEFVRNDGGPSYDSQVIDIDPESFFDAGDLRWYRARLESKRTYADADIDDMEFLKTWGFLVEKDGRFMPTRAAVFILGKQSIILQHLPRMVVDLQWHNCKASEHTIGDEWTDREIVETNLVRSWKAILNFIDKHVETPYEVDAKTLHRIDNERRNVSFREAAVNLLIHQDYGKANRDPVIRVFKDGIDFYNPGNAFASREDLVGQVEREHRNPKIVTAFERIGLSDQRGGGLKKIFEDWREFRYFPPEIENDKGDMTFRLRLSTEKLLDDERHRQATPTVQTRLAAFIRRKGKMDIVDLRALTGMPDAIALEAADALVDLGIAKRTAGGSPVFHLVEQNDVLGGKRGSATARAVGSATGRIGSSASDSHVDVGSATDQSDGGGSALGEFSEVQLAILKGADVPCSRSDLMKLANYSNRVYFVQRHLNPLMEGGFIEMTHPGKVNSPNQAYTLTHKGRGVRSRLLDSS